MFDTNLRTPPIQREKSSFRKGFVVFLGALALLFGLSWIFSLMVPEDLSKIRPKIALVEVTGMILDSKDVVRQLSDYRRDETIQGIILRVDSPGGVVAPSQEIYSEVIRVKQSGKPIYVSMGALAASGGYYVACPADKIVANPGTLTGSIGVIMTFANSKPLLDKIGVNPEIIKSGPFKDSGSAVRPMNPEERKVLQGVVDDVYDQFVEAVAKGRNLTKDDVKKFADGRIFTGRQAQGYQLVDYLGGLEKTIELLKKELGIKDRARIVQEKPQRTLMDWVMESRTPEKLLQSLNPIQQGPRLQFLWTQN